jgi:PPK2 family polyphosphate:nucleotide phosphotransferase
VLRFEQELIMAKLSDFDHLWARPGAKVRLAKFSTTSTKHVPPRDKADKATQKAAEQLGVYQYKLYAEGRQSLLVILQGMDASGKDGAVRKVFDNVNPTGVQVISFKEPSKEELRHDFLWRCHAKVPPRGYIGVFNRSYYEDVLVVRVHADRLLPPEIKNTKAEWALRFRMINEFENLLADGGTRVIKFFLHISKEEQRQRFIARQKDPRKHWKLAEGDFAERQFWDGYQEVYEKMLPKTSTKMAPWYIIPADHKWVRNYYMTHLLTATLRDMNPRPPELADKSLITKRFR